MEWIPGRKGVDDASGKEAVGREMCITISILAIKLHIVQINMEKKMMMGEQKKNHDTAIIRK